MRRFSGSLAKAFTGLFLSLRILFFVQNKFLNERETVNLGLREMRRKKMERRKTVSGRRIIMLIDRCFKMTNKTSFKC